MTLLEIWNDRPPPQPGDSAVELRRSDGAIRWICGCGDFTSEWDVDQIAVYDAAVMHGLERHT